MFLCSLCSVPAKSNQRYQQEHFKCFGKRKLSLSSWGASWVCFQVTSPGSKPCIQPLLNLTHIQKPIRICIQALQAVPMLPTVHLTTMNNLEIIKLLTKIMCCMTSVYGRLLWWLQNTPWIIIIAGPNSFLFFLWSVMYILQLIRQSCIAY